MTMYYVLVSSKASLLIWLTTDQEPVIFCFKLCLSEFTLLLSQFLLSCTELLLPEALVVSASVSTKQNEAELLS